MLSDKALEAKREYIRKWRQENREHFNEYMRKYRQEHREQIAKNQARYWERKVKKEEVNEA